MITVKELIEQLKKENPNAPVVKNTRIMLCDQEGEVFDEGDEVKEPVTIVKYDCVAGQVVIL